MPHQRPHTQSADAKGIHKEIAYRDKDLIPMLSRIRRMNGTL